jgi:hypothetical protein
VVTGRFPGVITPVPSAKTPVRLADPPAAIDVGFAVKLVMEEAETGLKLTESMQPRRQTRLKLDTATSIA